MATEKAVLAGGCFWGMQDMFRRLRGVVSTRVGYTGGGIANPSYGNHQGHAEAIEILFDPAVVTYRAVLEHFFQVHDPTTYEQQGSDFGPSYRSAIFYTDEQQKETARAEAAGSPRRSSRSRRRARRPPHQHFPRGAVLAGGVRASGPPATAAEGVQLPFVRPNWQLPSAQAFQKSRTAKGPETDPSLAAMVSQGRGSLPG